jgi:hypothetical protein
MHALLGLWDFLVARSSSTSSYSPLIKQLKDRQLAIFDRSALFVLY